MMNILVTTCDKNLHLLPGFAYLFNKYWSPNQPVTILGYAQPSFALPDNFTYFSLGDQADYPFNKWADALIDFLNLHPHWDTFVLLLEDYWIVRHADLDAIHSLYGYMRAHRNVIKMDLAAERLYAAGMTDYAYHGRLDLIKSDPDSMYHWSWWAGIWNRDALARVLWPGESAHDHELHGGPRLAALRDEIMVLGTRQYPLRVLSVNKYDEPGKLRLLGLREVDLRELNALGYVAGDQHGD